MKLPQHIKARVTLTLATGLFAAGTAGAQSYSYYYGNTTQPSYTGVGGAAIAGGSYTEGIQGRPTDFFGGQWNDKSNTVVTTPGTPNTTSAQSQTLNPASNAYSQTWSLGSDWGQDHDGEGGLTEEITSVTLYIYISSLSPNNASREFQLYSGLGGVAGGAIAGTVFSVTDPADEGGYFGISIPVALAQAGFSIGPSAAAGPQSPASLLQVVTAGGAANQQPGFAVTTTMVVPEPATALLSGLGSLLLLLRRRA